MLLSKFQPTFLAKLNKAGYSTSESSALFRYVLSDFFGLDYVRFQMDDQTLLPQQIVVLESIVKQLMSQKPYEQILGYVDFCQLPIRVSQDTLIPRPETEQLVLKLQEQKVSNNFAVLDVCTGSGCIALALKNKWKTAEVSALDVSRGALEIANYNSKRLGLDVDFVEQDILSDRFELSPKKWDLIVSNPPYVLDSERLEMKSNVLDFEPHLALFVEDENPLLYYKRIAELAFVGLKDHGELYFEINARLSEETKKAVEQIGFSRVDLIKDEFHKDYRFLMAKR